MKVVPPGDVRFCLCYINNEMELKSKLMAVKECKTGKRARETWSSDEKEQEGRRKGNSAGHRRGDGLQDPTATLNSTSSAPFRQLAWDF